MSTSTGATCGVWLSRVLLAVFLLGPTACTVHDNTYCDEEAGITMCPGNLVCHIHHCVPPDGGSGGSAGSAGTGGKSGDAAPDSPAGASADQAGGGTGGGGGDASTTDTAPDIATDGPTDTQQEVAPRCTPASCVTSSNGPFCDSDAGTCTRNCVLASSDSCGMVMDGGLPHCESTSQTCVACIVDVDCTSANKPPRCKQGTHQCVECLGDSDCTTGNNIFCVSDMCTNCATQGAHNCASLDPTKPTCRNDNQVCGECNTSADCSFNLAHPICVSHMCVPCTADSQCADKSGRTARPDVCMAHQDGRCAIDVETIYVQASTASVTCTTGTGTGAGTLAMPLCTPQGALALLSPTRRLIVVRGTVASGLNWTFPASPIPTEVSIVGQKVVTATGTVNGTIESGAAPGIMIDGAPVYLRGLTVENGTDVGVIIQNSTKVHVDRVIVRQNMKGGLLVRGSGFDITNSVFTSNGGVFATPLFGGVYLGFATANTPGSPHHFAFNTVTINQAPGVVVEDPNQVIMASLLFNPNFGNNIGGKLSTTTIATSTSPMLDTANPNHLTASSPCHDFITSLQITAASDEDPAAMPSDTLPPPLFDIDGDPRPLPMIAGSSYDCGADEFLGP